jgi:glycosyltransferase involved in cell wall biosynthesis
MVGPVPPPYGGIAAVMENILHSKLAREYRFDVFNKSDLFAPQVSGWWERNYLRIKRWFTFFFMVARGNYAFVHLQGSVWVFNGVVLYMLIARLAGAKILLHLHGTNWKWFYGEASRPKRFVARLGLRLPQKIIVLYEEWAQKIKELQPSVDVVVIPNWISAAPLPEGTDSEETMKRLQITVHDFVVITVGNVGWRKGTFDILKAVPIVARSVDNVRFVFAGNEEFPGQWREIMEEVETASLNEWVRFPGELPRDVVISLLHVAHVFLLPSHSEGMPIAVIEAMKAGLPIVVTPVGGIPEMVQHEVSALMIPPDAPEAIANAILRLYRDPALRKRLGEGARKAFSDKFAVETGIEQLAQIYSELLGEASSPPGQV